jgi:hypothetical protein
MVRVAVWEELHFGRAAQRLHLTQPSLSAQLQKLEKSLGVQLVARTSHEVRDALGIPTSRYRCGRSEPDRSWRRSRTARWIWRPQQRQRDPAVDLPRARGVHLSRLIVVATDASWFCRRPAAVSEDGRSGASTSPLTSTPCVPPTAESR